jgi:hypothetical protein
MQTIKSYWLPLICGPKHKSQKSSTQNHKALSIPFIKMQSMVMEWGRCRHMGRLFNHQILYFLMPSHSIEITMKPFKISQPNNPYREEPVGSTIQQVLLLAQFSWFDNGCVLSSVNRFEVLKKLCTDLSKKVHYSFLYLKTFPLSWIFSIQIHSNLSIFKQNNINQ